MMKQSKASVLSHSNRSPQLRTGATSSSHLVQPSEQSATSASSHFTKASSHRHYLNEASTAADQ